MPKRVKPLFWLVMTLLACGGQAHAQSLPDAAQTGRLLEERFPAPVPEPLSKQPRPKAVPQVPRQASEPTGPRFTLRQLKFQGVTVYTEQELQETFKAFVGREIALSELQTIAEQLTDKYRNDGYLLSSATVPPQEIADGVAVIGVNEGVVGNIVFDGLNAEDQSANLLRSVAEKLMSSQPLRQSVLETTLLLLNDIRGVSATAVFKPSPTDPTQIDLIIPIQQTAYEVRTTLNNRGTRYVGPWQGAVTGVYHGAISRFDTVTLQGMSGTDNQELFGFLAGYELPLNASGTTLNIEVNRAWSEPGYTLRTFDLESLNQRISLGVVQPLKRTRARNLKLEGTLNARYNTTKFDGTLLSEDDYRSVEASLEYDTSDARGGVTLFNFGMAQGLDLFGAKESGSALLTRTDGKSDFTKLTFYTSRSQSIASETAIFAAFNGQYALSQLLSAEEFGFGGATFGRAYDASELTGDHGAAIMFELRQNADMQGSRVISSAQLFAAYDLGAIWNIDHDSKGDRKTASSASIGLRYNLFNVMNGSVELAKPLTRAVGAFAEDSNKDPRFFAGFQIEF
jgi:hemolysin activation/secretion protein